MSTMILPESPEVELIESPKDRLAKLGHAVDFLNNHLPCYGARLLEDHDAWRKSTNLMHDVPLTVVDPFIDALEEAARYLARSFKGA